MTHALICFGCEGGKFSNNAPRLPVAALAAASSCEALVLGEDDALVEAVRSLEGVDRVHVAKGYAGNPESLPAGLKSILDGCTHVFAEETVTGRAFVAACAALLGVSPAGSILRVVDAAHFVKSVYSGGIEQAFETASGPVLATVRTSAFPRAGARGEPCPVDHLDWQPAAGKTVGMLPAVHTLRPMLSEADVIVSGGRGLDARGFAKLSELADRLHAGLGATRAAVDAELAPSENQVGQTGQIVAPDVYVAFGISGAMQHLSGIKDAKTVIAVNTDPEAPIMEVADFALIADARETVEKLLDML